MPDTKHTVREFVRSLETKGYLCDRRRGPIGTSWHVKNTDGLVFFAWDIDDYGCAKQLSSSLNIGLSKP
jgi:hypothetical protein